MEIKIREAERVRDSVCGQFQWIYSSHDNPGRRQPDEGYRIIDKVGPFNYKGLVTPWEEPLDIYYLYKSGKNVVFQTRSGESAIRKTLSEVYEELPEKEFIYVDRSFIVNIEHVMKLKNKEIHMSNGEIIPVSKPQLERVKMEINAYWRSHV